MSKAIKNIARLAQAGIITYTIVGLRAGAKSVVALLAFGLAAFVEGLMTEKGGESHG